MDLKAKKSFSSGYTGNVTPGQMLYDVPVQVAAHFIEHDLCDFVGGHKGQGPLSAGPEDASLSSQAGPASPQSNASTSDSGESKPPAESSQSTAPSNGPPGVTSSTPLTGPGGKSTTRKRRKTAKK